MEKTSLSGIQTVVMQVTDSCPFECPQCYARRGSCHLPPERAEYLLDRIFRNRFGVLQITGGEPLVYPYLDELLRFCAVRRIRTAVATSGYGCTSERLRELKEAGLDCLCVSLNGSTREIHEKTRQGYATALAALENARSEGLPCIVNWVACESNADDLPALIQLCRHYEVAVLSLLKKHPSFSGAHTDYPRPDQLRRIQRLMDGQDGPTVVAEICFHELRDPTERCRAGEDSLYVDCAGRISPCSMLRERDYGSPEELLRDPEDWKSLAARSGRCSRCP